MRENRGNAFDAVMSSYAVKCGCMPTSMGHLGQRVGVGIPPGNHSGASCAGSLRAANHPQNCSLSASLG